MNLYYFTFGARQEFEGYVQPVVASEYDIARKLMLNKYGTNWFMQYSANEWEFVKLNCALKGIPFDKELPPIIEDRYTNQKIYILINNKGE